MRIFDLPQRLFFPVETDNSASLADDRAFLESEEVPIETTPSEKAGERKDKKIEVKKPETKPEKKSDPAEPADEEVDQILEELEGFEAKASSESEDEEESAPSEILPHQRPTIKQISEKFPNLFKTFPSLKDSWFRERQFSEVFHTPAEAQTAAETAAAYNDLLDDVTNGTGEKILPALKESDSLGKFAKNFLPNLYKMDKDVHWKTILPILEDVVRVSFQDGHARNDENLQNAARVLSLYLFNNQDVAEGKRTFVERDEPKGNSKIDDEKKQWENEKYNSTLIDVNEFCYGEMVKEISRGFKETDGLSKFIKDSITERTIKEVMNVIRNDKAHMRYIDKLWAEAKSRNYRVDDKTRIINASLARAKSIIPSIRRRLIGEAIGQSPQNNQRKVEKVQQVQQRRDGSPSGAPQNNNRPPSSKRIDWKRTSDLDFLNDNFQLKRT